MHHKHTDNVCVINLFAREGKQKFRTAGLKVIQELNGRLVCV